MLLFPNLAGSGVGEEKNLAGFFDIQDLATGRVREEKNQQVLRPPGPRHRKGE